MISSLGQMAIILAALATGQGDGQPRIGAVPDLVAASQPNGEPKSEAGLTASDITALGALGVAVLVFVFGIKESKATRKHRRLSVEPYLFLLSETNYEGPVFTISITNGGIGPAKVEGFETVFRGKSFWGGDLAKLFSSFMEVVEKEFGDSISFEIHVNYSVVRSYLVGEKTAVFRFTGNGQKRMREAGLRLMKLFNDLKITVKYKSFYGDTYTARYPPKQDAPVEEDGE